MDRVPRRKMKDASTVSLTAAEEHLLGVIDGELTEQELGFISGLTIDDVGAALDALAGHGLVSFVGGSVRPPPPSAAEEAGESAIAEVELSVQHQGRIDELFMQLDDLDHYELLGLERDCDKKDVKAAYYRLAPEFHPDKHFRKNLGPYKQRIEAVFSTLTKAHDTLRYKKRRAEYDATLPPAKPGRRKNTAVQSASHPAAGAPVSAPPAAQARSVTPMPSRTPSRSAPPQRSSPLPQDSPVPRQEAEPAGRGRPSAASGAPHRGARPSRGTTARGSATPAHGERRARRIEERGDFRRSRSPSPENRHGEEPRSEPHGSGPGAAADGRTAGTAAADSRAARRDALRRKMEGGRRRKVSQSQPGYQSVEGVEQSAAEIMRGRFEKVGNSARQRRLDRYLRTAEQAMADRDYRTASAAYRQAVRLAPDDAALVEKLEQADDLAKGG
jgi:curved DNA-binding protein CbpA